MAKLYPKVVTVFRPAILSRGPWPSGKPVGVTVHHSADRDLAQVEAYGAAEKIGYHIIIDRDGSAHQTAHLDACVAHAGKASWNKVSPNRGHVAVCVLSWGRVKREGDKFTTWTTEELPHDQIAHRQGGYWDEATEIQELALWDCLEWLCREFGILPDNVCGHDECALPKGRKDDPGGVLSLTMTEVRAYLTRTIDPQRQKI